MAKDFVGNGTAQVGSAAKADPHGLAAVLLVESLIHVLLEQSVISLPSALDVVETALQVNDEMSADQDGRPSATDDARKLIAGILTSLRIDARDAPG